MTYFILLDPSTEELTIKAAHGLTDEEMRRGKYHVGEGITGEIVEDGDPIIVLRVGEEPYPIGIILDSGFRRNDATNESITKISMR